MRFSHAFSTITARSLDLLGRLVTALSRSPPTVKWGILDVVGVGMMFWFTTHLPWHNYFRTELSGILMVLISLAGLQFYNSLISRWFARRGCVLLVMFNILILPIAMIVAGSIVIVWNVGFFVLSHAQAMPDVLVLLAKDFGAGTITTFFVAVFLSRIFFPSRRLRSSLYDTAVHMYNWWLESEQEQGYYMNWTKLAGK